MTPFGWNPHLVTRRGRDWTLWAAPGRMIAIGQGGDWWPQGVNVADAANARALAAALVELADLTEQPEPDDDPDTTWMDQHEAGKP